MKNILTLVKQNMDVFITSIATLIINSIGMIVCLGIIIIIDTILGIRAAQKSKIPVTSRKLSTIVGKTGLYLLLIITGWMAAYIFDYDNILKFTICILSAIELKSIDENFRSIRGISILKYLRKFLNRNGSMVDTLKDATDEDNSTNN